MFVTSRPCVPVNRSVNFVISRAGAVEPPEITSARVDPLSPPAIFRPLRRPRGLPATRTRECPCGGTGRRARLKIEFRKECWFDSGQGDHPTVRPHSPTFPFPNKNGHKSHFRLRGYSPTSHGIRRLSWYLPW